ncbi:MAG TPA: sigma-70 factor domain-containing protein, partial [Acidimicrobiales bacterium]|nr:sigma-70 factor domain-containing protein [Acidimicrobiales bacterium]
MPNNHAAQPEEDLVRLYLNDIGKHSLLTKDDEARLAQAIEAGRTARSEVNSGKQLAVSRKR